MRTSMQLNALIRNNMDGLIKGETLSETQITEMFENILAVEVNDNVMFTFKKIQEIRENAKYPGYRLSFEAQFDETKQMLKIDVSTGDVITPKELEYQYKLMLEDRSINLLVYNVETVLAEKMQSILERGVLNTRAKDFFDVYILTAEETKTFDDAIFVEAFLNTVKNRETTRILNELDDIINSIESSQALNTLWERFAKANTYAENVSWQQATAAVKTLMGLIKN